MRARGEVRIGRSVDVGEVRIVPLERVRCWGGALGGLWIRASLEPLGTAAVIDGEVRLLDIDGEPLQPEALGGEEETRALLARLGSDG